MASLMNKARKPKFELHLWIYDLNNIPLVAGTSYVKWHLPNSIHGEYRGRTAKCSIDKIHHRVTYNYSKAVSLRISIDRSNNLSECPIEFEVLQEFPMVPGGRDERISLGTVRLNLSEYVEESENFPRRNTLSRFPGSPDNPRMNQYGPHPKLNAGRSAAETERTGTSSSGGAAQQLEEIDLVEEEAEEGIVRRYLMQDSRINSTLRIGVLMLQVDGERSYVAPPLKSATTFMGGISGLITGANEMVDPEEADKPTGGLSINRPRDAEAQDMYRRTLAASWDRQPGELHADECIEDIFAGGSGWRDGTAKKSPMSLMDSPNLDGASSSSSSRSSTLSSDDAVGGTLRSNDVRRVPVQIRPDSSASERSSPTTKGHSESDYSTHLATLLPAKPNPNTIHRGRQFGGRTGQPSPLSIYREGSGVSPSEDNSPLRIQSRNDSQTSLAQTLGSLGSSGLKMTGFRRLREIDEYELRDDLVAWKLPGTVI
ncbi:N-terminal C2 in EEIG1 and EHBP1 proteins-domain-containing protein [Xylaria nigripes]|nr:N-terminal C2 in EEIG1 and EHBP1 proteins-domain-containing protein [Xylaria nigripes]